MSSWRRGRFSQGLLCSWLGGSSQGLLGPDQRAPPTSRCTRFSLHTTLVLQLVFLLLVALERRTNLERVSCSSKDFGLSGDLQEDRVAELVARARQHFNVGVRIWGTPDNTHSWDGLARAGVQWINVDDAALFRNWYESRPSRDAMLSDDATSPTVSGPERDFTSRRRLRPAGTGWELCNGHRHYGKRSSNATLLAALDQGFCSIEADVFQAKRGGPLLVGHDEMLATPGLAQPLTSVFLRPLKTFLEDNPQHCLCTGGLTVMLDFKTPTAAAFARLQKEWGAAAIRSEDAHVLISGINNFNGVAGHLAPPFLSAFVQLPPWQYRIDGRAYDVFLPLVLQPDLFIVLLVLWALACCTACHGGVAVLRAVCIYCLCSIGVQVGQPSMGTLGIVAWVLACMQFGLLAVETGGVAWCFSVVWVLRRGVAPTALGQREDGGFNDIALGQADSRMDDEVGRGIF